MGLLVKAEIEQTVDLKNKYLTTKYNGKKKHVIFKVFVDEYSFADGILAQKTDSNILLLHYHGSLNYLNTMSNIIPENALVVYEEEVGADITEDDILKIMSEAPENITIALHLPSEFNDMNFVCEMSSKYPKLTFTGGYLFSMQNTNIGYITEATLNKLCIAYDKTSKILSGASTLLDIVAFDDIEIEISTKSPRTSRGSNSNSGDKPTPKNTKLLTFKELLYSSGEVPL